MAKGQCLGHAPCPYGCGNARAEVKEDKNKNPYIVCFGCGGPKKPVSQHFTLGDEAMIKRWLGGGKFKPVEGVTLGEWHALIVTAPAPAGGAGSPPPKKSSGLLID